MDEFDNIRLELEDPEAAYKEFEDDLDDQGDENEEDEEDEDESCKDQECKGKSNIYHITPLDGAHLMDCRGLLFRYYFWL